MGIPPDELGKLIKESSKFEKGSCRTNIRTHEQGFLLADCRQWGWRCSARLSGAQKEGEAPGKGLPGA